MKNSWTNKYGVTKDRFTRFGGVRGASDIFAIRPSDGRFIALEVKTPKTRNQATPAQREFIDQVNNHGGIAAIVWSTEMVSQLLDIKALF